MPRGLILRLFWTGFRTSYITWNNALKLKSSYQTRCGLTLHGDRCHPSNDASLDPNPTLFRNWLPRLPTLNPETCRNTVKTYALRNLLVYPLCLTPSLKSDPSPTMLKLTEAKAESRPRPKVLLKTRKCGVDIARKLGISLTTVLTWQNGKQRKPKPSPLNLNLLRSLFRPTLDPGKPSSKVSARGEENALLVGNLAIFRQIVPKKPKSFRAKCL